MRYEVKGWAKGDESGCKRACVIDESIYPIDACILWELTQLWEQGVHTECSCCGHQKREAKIAVSDEQSRQIMIDLGYEETEPMLECCTGCCEIWFRAKSQKICMEGADSLCMTLSL